MGQDNITISFQDGTEITLDRKPSDELREYARKKGMTIEQAVQDVVPRAIRAAYDRLVRDGKI